MTVLTIENRLSYVIWMCLAFSIVLADVVLQWQEQQRSRPAARAAKAVAA
jgi:hypothetical protein